MNGIFIPQEILTDERLNPNDKFLLAYYWYNTRKQNEHCCKKMNSDIMDDLKISERTLTRAKRRLKDFGLIQFNGGIKVWYVGNEGSQIDREGSQIDREDSQIDREDSQNDREGSQIDREDSQNDREDSQNDYHNKEIKKNKEIKNKEIIKNKATDESLDDFLSSWEEDTLKNKKEHIDNSCTVVDMVMGLPVKDDVPIKDEPEIKIETDRNTIIDVLAKKMVDKITHSIRTQVSEIKQECDKQMFLKENEFNELQLTKHIKEYLKDRNLDKILQDVTVFDRFAINAFNSYKNEIKRTITKLPKNNPYSDLDGSNSNVNEYKETNRWLK